MSPTCENSDRIAALEEEVMGNSKSGRPSLREEFNHKLLRIQTIVVSLGLSTVGLLIANLIASLNK